MKRYFKHKLENLIVVNRVVTLYFFEFDKNYKHDAESHDFWEMVFVKKGEIVCTADDKKITLKQGEMIFHKPNESHSLSCNGHSAPDVIVLSFVCRSEAMRFFENRILKPEKQQVGYLHAILDEARKTFDVSFPDPEMKKMEFLPRPSLGGGQVIKNYLEIFLIELMRSLTESEHGNKTFLSEYELGNKLVDDVIKVLKSNVFSNVSIDDVCTQTSYSRAYVFRQFKLATGKSVMDFYTDLKMKEARSLLRENELSVREIAEKLCYDTPNYFSKTFKKINGITPTGYKKKIIGI